MEFICESVDTRSGFAHIAEMYIGNDMYPYGRGRVNYYNRTWECWRYQTVCKSIVAEMLAGIEFDHGSAGEFSISDHEKQRRIFTV